MRSIRARLSEERGWGLVSSVLVVGILISLSLPLLSLVDAQQSQSAHERKSESSFNLAEAALDASMFVLGKDWPALATSAYPSACTRHRRACDCPSAGPPDPHLHGRRLHESRLDRAGPRRHRDRVLRPGGHPFDAELGRERQREGVGPRRCPRGCGRPDGRRAREAHRTRPSPSPATPSPPAGSAPRTTATRSSWTRRGTPRRRRRVAVRCTLPAPSRLPQLQRPRARCRRTRRPRDMPATSDRCGRGRSSGLRAKAKTLGTYYASGCPASLTGELVFVENGDCSYTGGGQRQLRRRPGMLVIANGTLSFGGNFTYYGLVYGANLQQLHRRRREDCRAPP